MQKNLENNKKTNFFGCIHDKYYLKDEIYCKYLSDLNSTQLNMQFTAINKLITKEITNVLEKVAVDHNISIEILLEQHFGGTESGRPIKKKGPSQEELAKRAEEKIRKANERAATKEAEKQAKIEAKEAEKQAKAEEKAKMIELKKMNKKLEKAAEKARKAEKKIENIKIMKIDQEKRENEFENATVVAAHETTEHSTIESILASH